MKQFRYVLIAFMLSIFSVSAYSEVENSYKLQAILGTGYSAIRSSGVGFTYGAYFKKQDKKLMHTLDVNLYLLNVKEYEHQKKFGITDNEFQLNFFVGYGLGFTTQKNTKITFDIIGLGVNVTTRPDTLFDKTKNYTKIGTLANFIGVQATFENGLYLAWRNTFTGYNWRTREDYRKGTSISDAGEFKTLFMIGYNFGNMVK